MGVPSFLHHQVAGVDTTFAIVGTAGRKDDAFRLSGDSFKAMCMRARLLLKQFNTGSYEVDTLVSGGAAWADHVAVTLFLNKEVPRLKLFFPCGFDGDPPQYDPTPLTEKERTRGFSTGDIANRLHARFSKVIGVNSLGEIKRAIQQGAEVQVVNGFFARNALVAQSDIILAMTFGEREWVKDGGTSHTVTTYLNRVKKQGFFDKSFHYNLSDGNIYRGCRVRSTVTETK